MRKHRLQVAVILQCWPKRHALLKTPCVVTEKGRGGHNACACVLGLNDAIEVPNGANPWREGATQPGDRTVRSLVRSSAAR